MSIEERVEVSQAGGFMSSTGLRYSLILAMMFFVCTSQARPFFREGGVSGGGGNVINPTPPNEALDGETAEEIVKASFKYVHIYLQDKASQYQNNEMSPADQNLYAKIFEGNNNIINAVGTIRPKVEDERPCFDFASKPVDASVVSRKPNTFCVSAFSLGQKVIHSEIPIQSTALMIHEYSELIGLSEDEAVIFQTKALEDLKTMELPPLEISEDDHH